MARLDLRAAREGTAVSLIHPNQSDVHSAPPLVRCLGKWLVLRCSVEWRDEKKLLENWFERLSAGRFMNTTLWVATSSLRPASAAVVRLSNIRGLTYDTR